MNAVRRLVQCRPQRSSPQIARSSSCLLLRALAPAHGKEVMVHHRPAFVARWTKSWRATSSRTGRNPYRRAGMLSRRSQHWSQEAATACSFTLQHENSWPTEQNSLNVKYVNSAHCCKFVYTKLNPLEIYLLNS